MPAAAVTIHRKPGRAQSEPGWQILGATQTIATLANRAAAEKTVSMSAYGSVAETRGTNIAAVIPRPEIRNGMAHHAAKANAAATPAVTSATAPVDFSWSFMTAA